MKSNAKNRIMMWRSPVVSEVKASATDRRAWITLSREEEQIVMVEFEHIKSLRSGQHIDPDEVLDRVVSRFATLPEAIDALTARGIDTDRFDAPQKVGYPL